MLHNHTGSIIGTYDLNGAQQEGEDFYPFGETAHNWNGNKMHRFGGKLRSFSSGFYLFGARQYAPWLAKFTSVDPLAAKSTDRNPYHYASNNPINRTDPTGMSDGKGDGKGGGDSSGKAQKTNGATIGQKMELKRVDSKSIVDPGGNIALVDVNTISWENNKVLSNRSNQSVSYNKEVEAYVDPQWESLASQKPITASKFDPVKEGVGLVKQDATFRENARDPFNVFDADNRKERFTFYSKRDIGIKFPFEEINREESYKIKPIEDPTKGTGGWSAVSNFFDKISNYTKALENVGEIFSQPQWKLDANWNFMYGRSKIYEGVYHLYSDPAPKPNYYKPIGSKMVEVPNNQLIRKYND